MYDGIGHKLPCLYAAPSGNKQLVLLRGDPHWKMFYISMCVSQNSYLQATKSLHILTGGTLTGR